MSRRHNWTPEQDQLIFDRRAQGHSYGMIADELGMDISDNGVISRARRLGVPPSKTRKTKWRKSLRSKAAPKVECKPVAAPKAKPAAKRARRAKPVLFLEAGPNQCRWPVGRWDRDPDCPLEKKQICGRHVIGGPWCEEHMQIGTHEAYGRFSDKNMRAA